MWLLKVKLKNKGTACTVSTRFTTQLCSYESDVTQFWV